MFSETRKKCCEKIRSIFFIFAITILITFLFVIIDDLGAGLLVQSREDHHISFPAIFVHPNYSLVSKHSSPLSLSAVLFRVGCLVYIGGNGESSYRAPAALGEEGHRFWEVWRVKPKAVGCVVAASGGSMIGVRRGLGGRRTGAAGWRAAAAAADKCPSAEI